MMRSSFAGDTLLQAENEVIEAQNTVDRLEKELHAIIEEKQQELEQAKIVLLQKTAVLNFLHQNKEILLTKNSSDNALSHQRVFDDYLAPNGKIMTERLFRDVVGVKKFTVESILGELISQFGNDTLKQHWKEPRISVTTFLYRACKKGILIRDKSTYQFI